jgi:UDP-glucose 4-epimerase
LGETILVTGGAGFIGSHVVDALLEAGRRVVVIDDLSTGSRENLNPEATFYCADICSEETADIFAREKPALVCHFAAQMNVHYSVQNPIFDANTNVLGSINLLENAIRHGVSKFIFASTAGAIYGEPETVPVPETHPSRPMCHYGVSKFAVEQYLHLYGRLYELPYTILRFANVYGPRQNPKGEAGVCAILLGLMLDNMQPVLYGFGEPVREYVYVEDVARAVMAALTRGNGETFNIGTGKGISVMEVFRALQKRTGFGQEPRLESLRRGEVNRIFTDCEKAARLLGWRAEVDFDEGLARTVDYFQK